MNRCFAVAPSEIIKPNLLLKMAATAGWGTVRKTIATLVILLASDVAAQSRAEVQVIEEFGPKASLAWGMFTGISSATLASEGADLVASTGFSWPDGRQALVTFWRPTQEPYIWADTVRCVDYFDGSMQSTGGACYIPRNQ